MKFSMKIEQKYNVGSFSSMEKPFFVVFLIHVMHASKIMHQLSSNDDDVFQIKSFVLEFEWGVSQCPLMRTLGNSSLPGVVSQDFFVIQDEQKGNPTEFISSQSFHYIICACDGLILYLEMLRRSFPDVPITSYYLGSDQNRGKKPIPMDFFPIVSKSSQFFPIKIVNFTQNDPQIVA